MNAIVPVVSHGRRHSATFYALLPIVLFALAVVSWCTFSLAMLNGVLMMAPPIGLALLPFSLFCIYALYSLAALWLTLTVTHSSVPTVGLRFAAVAIGCMLAVASAAFIAARIRETGEGEYGPWAVGGLFAYAISGVLLLVAHVSSITSRPGPGLPWKILLVAGTWVVSITGIMACPALLQEWIQVSKIQASRQIRLDSYDPVALALCDGNVQRARSILVQPQYQASPWPAIQCISTHGWIDEHQRGRIFFAERVPVVLDAILKYEQQNGVASRPGCTELQIQLLRKLIQERPRALASYRERGLRVDCTTDDPHRSPEWWHVAFGDAEHLRDLSQLVAVGIDLLQRDAGRGQLLSSNVNSFVRKIASDPLLEMVEHGMDLQAPDRRAPHLAVEVMWRRFERSSQDRGSVEKLLAMTGEPTYEQVVEAAEVGWYEFSQRSRDERYDHAALRSYIATLRATTQHDPPDAKAVQTVLDYLESE
jgi:hypothetical protein